MSDIFVRVAETCDETSDIRTFKLAPVESGNLPEFEPGSHVDVKMETGITRQYSLCGDLEDLSSYLIGVKKEPDSRGGSQYMHENVNVGDTLTISTPRNNFPLDETAPHSILLAGGIGVTPIISMADRLHKLGASFEFHYFSRGPSNTAFHERLTDVPYTRGIHLHYSLDPDGVRAYLRKLLWSRPEGGQLYLCGPKPFMDTVETIAAATWPPDAVNLEYFVADSEALSGDRDEFEVTLARTGGTYSVPAEKTIAEALIDNGVPVDLSCEQGVCGTCLTGLLEGEADHRDMFLSPDERAANTHICLCVSRAKSSKLVLDI